jgi:DNA-binding CsgD family transcriptional regulator
MCTHRALRDAQLLRNLLICQSPIQHEPKNFRLSRSGDSARPFPNHLTTRRSRRPARGFPDVRPQSLRPHRLVSFTSLVNTSDIQRMPCNGMPVVSEITYTGPIAESRATPRNRLHHPRPKARRAALDAIGGPWQTGITCTGGSFSSCRRGGTAMRLSTREETILRLIAAGRSDKQIARELRISVHTVRTHLDRIYSRNGLHNRAEAVAAWLRALPNPAKVSR